MTDILLSDEDFTIELFCRVDDKMQDAQKHPQAKLYPSEVVTLALLFALKGVGNRPFYRWVKRNLLHLFPNLPHRTRLFRLFNSHRHWTELISACDPPAPKVIYYVGLGGGAPFPAPSRW